MSRQPRRAVVPALIALAMTWAVGCDEGGDGSRAFDLSGRVMVESSTGAEPSPLGGVHVTFTSDTGLVTDTTTGDDGRYEMQVLSDVDFGQVRAERDGFTRSEQTVLFDVPARRIDFVLRPAVADE